MGMTTTAVSICNQALSLIGIRQQISSLTTDGTVEANQANLFYDQVRQSILQSFPWAFALRRATLVVATVATVPVIRSGWNAAYWLPADCLLARSIWFGSRNPRSSQRVPFTIEVAPDVPASGGNPTWSRLLLTDVGVDAVTLLGPQLWYTADVTDPLQMPPVFIDALAAAVGARLAMPLSVDAAMKSAAEHALALALANARAVAFSEGQEDAPPDSEIIASRGYAWPPFTGQPPPAGWEPY
jgi:hypothetical protein